MAGMGCELKHGVVAFYTEMLSQSLRVSPKSLVLVYEGDLGRGPRAAKAQIQDFVRSAHLGQAGL